MIVHAYYPLGETRVERQAQALVARGFDVDVICLRDENEPAYQVEGGIAIYRLSVKRHKGKGLIIQLFEYLAFFLLSFVRVAALHLQRRYAVVQVHNLPDFLIFAATFPKLTGARLILDFHDLMPEFYAARFDVNLESLPVRLICWQERVSCWWADHIVTVTDLWRETLVARGVPVEKVSVVMNVADDQVFRPELAAQRLHKQDDHFTLIYHGNLTERYGIDLAIRAVGAVRGRIPTIQLIIHGGGEYRQALENLVEVLGLSEYIRFSTQFMPTYELPQFIMQADVGVVPYRRDVFTDGILPTKLMEYVALGVPVIASRTSAVAAYFDDSMIEFFTPGDVNELVQSITRLYEDKERLEQLAQRAEAFIQRYNWSQIGAEYVALVKRLGVH